MATIKLKDLPQSKSSALTAVDNVVTSVRGIATLAQEIERLVKFGLIHAYTDGKGDVTVLQRLMSKMTNESTNFSRGTTDASRRLAAQFVTDIKAFLSANKPPSLKFEDGRFTAKGWQKDAENLDIAAILKADFSVTAKKEAEEKAAKAEASRNAPIDVASRLFTLHKALENNGHAKGSKELRRIISAIQPVKIKGGEFSVDLIMVEAIVSAIAKVEYRRKGKSTTAQTTRTRGEASEVVAQVIQGTAKAA